MFDWNTGGGGLDFSFPRMFIILFATGFSLPKTFAFFNFRGRRASLLTEFNLFSTCCDTKICVSCQSFAVSENRLVPACGRQGDSKRELFQNEN